jgi:hypothetical protein
VSSQWKFEISLFSIIIFVEHRFENIRSFFSETVGEYHFGTNAFYVLEFGHL